MTDLEFSSREPSGNINEHERALRGSVAAEVVQGVYRFTYICDKAFHHCVILYHKNHCSVCHDVSV